MARLVQSQPILWQGGLPFSGYVVAELIPPSEYMSLTRNGQVMPRFCPLRVEKGYLSNSELPGNDEVDAPGSSYILHLYDEYFYRRSVYPAVGTMQIVADTPLPSFEPPKPDVILPAIPPVERSEL